MPNPTATRRTSPYVAVNGVAMRRRRTDRGETVKDFAARVGLSQPYVTQIELSGETAVGRRVSPSVFRRICDALDMQPEELRVEED